MINLYNKDCLEAMKEMGDNSFDLAIVDPPYGINVAKEHKGGDGWTARENKDWDKQIPPPKYYKELFRISNNQIIWGANYMTIYLPPSMGWIFWDKGQRAFSLADGELAYTSFNRAIRVFDMPRGRAKAKNDKEGGRIHPTQKPIQLYEWILMNYAEPGWRIIDTHCGSGSVMIACDRLGFDLEAFELDKEHYEDSLKRYRQVTAQKRLFKI